jgi:hypothetical protein
MGTHTKTKQARGHWMKRLLFVVFFAASCANPGPTEPTDVRTGFIASDQHGEEVGTIEIDPEAVVELETSDLAATAKTFTLTGIVTDKAYSAWKISSGNVTITPGTVKGTTTSTGKYTLRLRAGSYTIKIAKSGYTTATIRRSISANTTLNVPLAPIKPRGATARCKNRTWSFSQNRRGTCSHHKGVAYWVCPGKLCS